MEHHHPQASHHMATNLRMVNSFHMVNSPNTANNHHTDKRLPPAIHHKTSTELLHRLLGSLRTVHLLLASLHTASSQATGKHHRRRPTVSRLPLTDNMLPPPATHRNNPTVPLPQSTANPPTAHLRPTPLLTPPRLATPQPLLKLHGTAAPTRAPSAVP